MGVHRLALGFPQAGCAALPDSRSLPFAMAVPDFQTLMLPVLQVFSDGAEHTSREVRERVAAAMHLSEADLEEMLPSGTQPSFHNRVHWALWYLQKCGLAQRSRRGVHRITDRGRQVLAGSPARIDLRLLSQFSEYGQIQRRGNVDDGDTAAPATSEPLATPSLETPDAVLERAWLEHRGAVEEDLLQRLLGVSPDDSKPS